MPMVPCPTEMADATLQDDIYADIEMTLSEDEPAKPALATPEWSQARVATADALLSHFAFSDGSAPPPAQKPPPSTSAGLPQSNLNPAWDEQTLLPTLLALWVMVAAKYAPPWLLARWGIFRVLDRVLVPRGGLFCTPMHYSTTFSHSVMAFNWAFRSVLVGVLIVPFFCYMFLTQPFFLAMQLWGVPLNDMAYKVFLIWSREVQAVHSAPLETGPAFIIVGCWMLLWAYVGIIHYHLSSQRRTRALGIDKTDFPSVAHELFHSHTPFLMVSYKWSSPSSALSAPRTPTPSPWWAGLASCGFTSTSPQVLTPSTPSPSATFSGDSTSLTPSFSQSMARSLAHALPGSWVDISNLGARDLEATMTRNAATSYALVIFLDRDYLKSKACALELQAAALGRHSERQLSYVFCTENSGVPADMLQTLEAAGFHIIRCAADLLRELSQHAYSSTAPEDSQRLLRHMRERATPNTAWDGTLLLPSPAVTAKQRFLLTPLATHFLPPAGSIIAGHAFLSPDGLQNGIYFWGVTLDDTLSALFFFSLACLIFGVGFLWGRQFELSTRVLWSLFTLGSLLLPRIFLKFMITRRSTHSPQLLGLNAASFCSDIAAISIVFVLGSKGSVSAARAGEDLVKDIFQRCRAIRGFIEEHVGLRTEEVGDWLELQEGLQRVRGAIARNRLLVFLVQDVPSAEAYLSLPTHSTSLVLTYEKLLGVRGVGGQTLGSSALCILLGGKGGVQEAVPYKGIAPAVLDKLSSMVSAVLLQAPPAAAAAAAAPTSPRA